MIATMIGLLMGQAAAQPVSSAGRWHYVGGATGARAYIDAASVRRVGAVTSAETVLLLRPSPTANLFSADFAMEFDCAGRRFRVTRNLEHYRAGGGHFRTVDVTPRPAMTWRPLGADNASNFNRLFAAACSHMPGSPVDPAADSLAAFRTLSPQD